MLEYSPEPYVSQERIRFSIDEMIACIDQRLALHRQRKRASRRHPHETRSYLATLRVRLLKAKNASSSIVKWQQLTDANHQYLAYFVMYLLQIGCGVVWCAECQQEYPAAQLTAQQWRRLSFGGDIVFCPKGHVVYSDASIIGPATDAEDVIIYSPLVDE